MEKIQNLLNQVSIIIKKNDELLDATSGRFNVFSLCNIDHYETKHSQIIAEFLNPKGSHGFGNQFLNAFMEIIKEENGENEEIKGIKLKENANVRTEHGEGVDGRIDIFILDEENAVIIENKIYARDQWKQLIRYKQFAEKYKKSIILYLTLDGSAPSDESSKGVEYTIISYKDTITKWLERCIQISALRPIVRETLLQYKNHINKLTGLNMESQYKNEVINICSKQENIEGAFAIFKSQDQIKNNIIKTHLIPQLEEIAKERGLDFDYGDFNSKQWSKLRFKKWKYVQLVFEFNSKDYNALNYGILCIGDNKETLLKNEKIEAAINKLCKHNGNNWCSDKKMEKYRDWNSEAFIDMANGELSKEIAKVIDEVLGIVDGLDL